MCVCVCVCVRDVEGDRVTLLIHLLPPEIRHMATVSHSGGSIRVYENESESSLGEVTSLSVHHSGGGLAQVYESESVFPW